MKTIFNFQVRAGFKPAPYCLLLLALLLLLPLALGAQNLTVCAGEGFMITSKADAQSISGGVTYTWYVSKDNGAPASITNSNAAFISIPEGRPVGTYAYVRRVASDACMGGASTTPYTVVVHPLPVASSAPKIAASAVTCADGNAVAVQLSYTIDDAQSTPIDNVVLTHNGIPLYTWTSVGSGSLSTALVLSEGGGEIAVRVVDAHQCVAQSPSVLVQPNLALPGRIGTAAL